jgi:2'-5' RNA ligase
MPSKEIRDEARNVQRALAKFSYKLNFTNLEQIHLTIKFLGNKVSTASAETVFSGLGSHSSLLVSPEIIAEGVRFGLKGQSNPNIVQIDIAQSPELKEIIDTVQDIVRNCGLDDVIRRKDMSRLLGHMTIARVRKDISKSHIKQIRAVLEGHKFQQKSFVPEHLYIIESILTRRGPIYKIYGKIPLNVPKSLQIS